MTDRLLARCLWFLIMALIAGSALGSLILMYSGLFTLIGHRFQMGGVVVASGVVLGVGAWMLCTHSEDLMDRRP
jgi:polyferredoxin